MLHFFEDLLIHGEGDGAGAAPEGQEPGQEASGVTAPVAGERKRTTKAERRAELEKKLAAERAAQGPQETAQETKADEKRPYDEIRKLYHDEIGQDIQTAVTGRVKNLKDSSAELDTVKAQLEKSNALLSQLASTQFEIQPAADGVVDFAAIEGKLKQAQAEEYALEHGVSEEYAAERMDMEAKLREQDRQLRELRAAEEKRNQDAEQYAAFQKHREQAEAFRQKVPGFDLIAEMEKTPLFAHLLSCGVNVENAYYAAHHEELMAYGQQAAAMQAQRALAASIQAGQSMPTEGGLGRSPAASPQRVMNFKGRSKAERKALHEAVRRGEKIYL